MQRVLVLGGYGAFGGRVAERLARVPRDRADRSPDGRWTRRKRSRRACGASGPRAGYPRSRWTVPRSASMTCTARAADRADQRHGTLSGAGLQPGARLHRGGRALSRPRRRARIRHRHYGRWMREARAAGVLVVSGASTVPGLSGAVVDAYAPQFAIAADGEHRHLAGQQLRSRARHHAIDPGQLGRRIADRRSGQARARLAGPAPPRAAGPGRALDRPLRCARPRSVSAAVCRPEDGGCLRRAGGGRVSSGAVGALRAGARGTDAQSGKSGGAAAGDEAQARVSRLRPRRHAGDDGRRGPRRRAASGSTGTWSRGSGHGPYIPATAIGAAGQAPARRHAADARRHAVRRAVHAGRVPGRDRRSRHRRQVPHDARLFIAGCWASASSSCRRACASCTTSPAPASGRAAPTWSAGGRCRAAWWQRCSVCRRRDATRRCA